jgi:hypothetical protein
MAIFRIRAEVVAVEDRSPSRTVSFFYQGPAFDLYGHATDMLRTMVCSMETALW